MIYLVLVDTQNLHEILELLYVDQISIIYRRSSNTVFLVLLIMEHLIQNHFCIIIEVYDSRT